MTEDTVAIYTDGACDPNPGPGGWAAILRFGRHEKALSGSDPATTNNRMELTAALQALQALKRPCQVILHTDSEYLRQGITEWLPNWQARGWRRKGGELSNVDLWQALAAEVERHEVEWRWVRGHAGDPLNERVDALARAAIPRMAVAADPGAAQIYPRASCLGAPGMGGWAVVVRRGDQLSSRSGTVAETTANEMELQAVLEGLKTLDALESRARVQVFTVSQYVHQGITRWVAGWQARGWKTKEGQPVRHKEHWLALQEAAKLYQIEWHLLSAADRPTESEQAAQLAAQAARSAE
jgi:ribonuclease HI